MRILPAVLLIAVYLVATSELSSTENASRRGNAGPVVQKLDAEDQPFRIEYIRPTVEATSVTGSSLRWYGFYDPFTGTAVLNDMWTFDHGYVDPLEGWTTNDSTENDFVAWKRVTPGTWAGHGNVPSAPVIAGTASVWLGFFEDEAAHSEFKAGLGYGDLWCQQLRSPQFVSGSGSATLSFDFFYDMESDFDTLFVVLEQDGGRTAIADFTGKSGSPASPLHFSQTISPAVLDTFNILFEFVSDGVFSDCDSLYATDLGPFGLDNVDLQGTSLTAVGQAPPYDFEAGFDGFVAVSCSGLGTFAGVSAVADYALSDPDCGFASNIVELHDDSHQHHGWQNEILRSPPVALPGTGGPFNIFADYDVYSDLDVSSPTPFNYAWSYYPRVCSVCGDSLWSIPKGSGNLFYGSNEPDCHRFRTFATDTASGISIMGAGKIVPDGADSVRFYLHVLNFYNITSDTPAPMFDNIRIGVSDRATVLHVPSPTYTTIQMAIDAASAGDTVLVRSGVYAGTGNKNLHFNGVNIVLMSEDGPDVTIVDCGGAGRGMEISTVQDSTTVVQGFTFKNGNGDGMEGGGVYVDLADVTFIDCVFDSNSTSMLGGGVWVQGDPTFVECRFVHNWADDRGGGVSVDFGAPTFVDCTFEKNGVGTLGGGVAVVGSDPLFFNCVIDSNTSNIDAGGVYVNGGFPVFEMCHINGNDALNDGGGVFTISSTGTVLGCEISFNTAGANGGGVMNYGDFQHESCVVTDNYTLDEGGGVYVASGNPTFDGCFVLGNGSLGDGGGVSVTGSSTAAFAGCVIDDNWVHLNGGGVFVHSAAPLFLGCEIARNEIMGGATWGGGVMATGGTFIECNIIDNVTLSDGGGVSVPSGDPSFQDCRIAGNDASSGGGIAITNLAAPDFTRCVITGNRGQTDGGGISLDIGGPSLPNIAGCTIADNDAGSGGGGGIRVTNTQVTAYVVPIAETIVWGNCSTGQGEQIYVTSTTAGAGLEFTCSDVDSSGAEANANGIVSYLADNIFENPWFCQPVDCALAPITGGEYQLRNASPCLAARNPCLQLIGALGMGCTSTAVDDDAASLPTEYRLFQNAPNPFNPVTRIAFDTPRSGHVELRVYDVSGSLVRTIVNDVLPSARHYVSWDGRDDGGGQMASGVYFYRLVAPGFGVTLKMVLLK